MVAVGGVVDDFESIVIVIVIVVVAVVVVDIDVAVAAAAAGADADAGAVDVADDAVVDLALDDIPDGIPVGWYGDNCDCGFD